MNADGLKRILCSKSFGKKSEELRYRIAQIARRLCTDKIEPRFLNAFTASRLVPLGKDGGTGVRPIGIGEVIRRVIGKSVMRFVKLDVIEGSGSLQVCSGQQSGCEAAIHGIAKIFQEDETECVLLIDASNAFNCMNRETGLHNVKYICPPLAPFLRNIYRRPSDLIIRGVENCELLKSEEGATQGCPAASGWYELTTVPMIRHLDVQTNCHQAFLLMMARLPGH